MKPFQNRSTHWLKDLLVIVIGLAVYWLIVMNRTNEVLRFFSLRARFGFASTIAVVGALFFGCLYLDRRYRFKFSLITILILFGLTLAGVWAQGYTGPQIIGGLLPATDANTYYQDSLRIANPALLAKADRVFFSAFYGLFVNLSGTNLQLSLAYLFLFIAFIFWFSLYELNHIKGPLIAAFFGLFTFFFIRYYAGKVMTETLGFILGTLSLLLILRSLQLKNRWIALLGIFVFSMAVNVRPGSIGLLPLLFILILFSYKKDYSFISNLLYCLGFAGIGFLVNLIVINLFGLPGSFPFSNLAQSLYGLARGGGNWGLIFIEHPEIRALPGTEYSLRIFQLVIEEIKMNPFNLIKGIFHQYYLLFSFVNSDRSIFSFFTGENNQLNNFVQIILYLLAIIGLVTCWKNRNASHNQLILFSLLGIVISIPIMPITDFAYMRAFAAAIPFLALLPATGLEFLAKKIGYAEKMFLKPLPMHLITSVSLLIVLLPLLIPLLVRNIESRISTPEFSCPPGDELIVATLNSGSHIRILPSDESFVDWLPDYHEAKFKHELHDQPSEDALQKYDQFNAPVIFYDVIDELSGKGFILVLADRSIPEKNGRYVLCGVADAQHVSDYLHFFHIRSYSYIIIQ